MAGDTEQGLCSALQCLENVAVTRGYLKKETKEDIRNSVSVIRRCFNELKTALESNMKGKQSLASEHKSDKTPDIDCEGGESRPAGQVAPSTGHSLETTTSAGRLWTSSGQKDNYDSAAGGNESRKNQSRETSSDKRADSDGDQQSGIGNQRQETSSGRTDNQASGGPPIRAGGDIEEIVTRKITQRLESMMENILGNIKRMVQEEISNSAKQNTDPGRGTATKRLEANRLQHPAAGQDAEAPRTQHANSTRPRPHRVPQRGIAYTNRLKAEERNVWIYVGRLSSETTADDITRYLKENGIEHVSECEMLDTRGTNRAFKLAVPFRYHDIIFSPDFWPEDVTFRSFGI
ncbi:hypothetical protein ANN_21171 [Periplaneta americana]|uniref:Uncharacterized protein n=1 Tax=Periplaneta americana TaxID=6978 RepID=A0ABQ8SF10_PERAM|nr:hypothetical protein ANN_21171 [Periplaneta americana]